MRKNTKKVRVRRKKIHSHLINQKGSKKDKKKVTMGKCGDMMSKIWAIEKVRLLTIAAGIMGCFTVYGIMQEKVMRSCYGGEVQGKEKKCSGDSFTFEFTFVLLLCACYTLVAKREYLIID